MESERWQRIKEVFAEAAELSAHERADFLEKACGQDTELRLKVERLLDAHDGEGSLGDPNALLPAEEPASRIKSPLDSLENQEFGRYRILRLLGKGGMGQVWLAEDSTLRRKAAIKLLPPRLISDPDALRRFEREARTASGLNHPGLLTIYEVGEARIAGNSHYYIATEFIEGETIRERLSRGKMEIEEALSIARQVASALQAAHAAGVIHRDIKPENIMVRRDGLVKILDFGLAKAAWSEINAGVQDSLSAYGTEAGMVAGTPRYMSPEQANGKPLDERTDIFSLGVVIYEMVTGRPPFAGASMAEVFFALLGKEAEPVDSEALDDILRTALAKNRDRRYAKAADLARDLEQIIAERPRPSGTISTHTKEITAAASKSRVRPLTAALAGIVAVVGIGFGVSRVWDKQAGNNPMPPTTIQVTSFSGGKDYAAFSPDGAQIAFAWDGTGKTPNGSRDIYIKVIDAGDPLRLTATVEDESFPAWSPDGRYIAFLRSTPRRSEYGVYLVPALGGPARQIAEASGGLSWSPDGEHLLIGGIAGGTDGGSLFALSVKTGERKRLTTAPPPYFDRSGSYSPDGKTIAYLRSVSNSARDIYLMSSDGANVKQLTAENRPIFGLTWTQDGREIVYSASRGGGRGLWRIPAVGGSPRRVLVTGQSPTWPAISRQGNRLVYTDSYTDSNFYLYRGSGFSGNPMPGRFGEPEQFLSSTREDTSPQFSPDGEKVAFASQRSGSEEIWTSLRDGSQLTKLTQFDGPAVGTPRWSPDGRMLVFDSRAAGSPDIYLIGSTGGQPKRLTSEVTFESKASWSGDGKWIYYASDRTGRSEMWKMPPEGEPGLQVTKTGAFEGFESPDGKTLYFSKDRGIHGLWQTPVEGGEERPVPGLERAGAWRSWGVLKQGIYFATTGGPSENRSDKAARRAVRFFRFDVRQVVPLVTPSKDPLFWEPGLTLSPDGRLLIFAQLDHMVNDIILMDHFR